MFSPSKVIVVDDKLAHLNAIVEHFRLHGSPCLGIHYTGEEELNASFFSGVRYLFMDLHLLPGGSSTDNKVHYNAIANILESSIGVDSGPFALIIWTENAQLENELTIFLEDRLDTEKPHTRPMAILTIDKNHVIDISSGKAKSETVIQTAIEKALNSSPQLLALLEWEKNVTQAGAATLSSLINLVPPDKRNSKSYSAALDQILSQLAEDAFGSVQAKAHPGAAINSALAPIMADRLIAKTSYQPQDEVWKNAVPSLLSDDKRKIETKTAAQVNSMMHIAVHDGEEINAVDWGIVVDLPELWNQEAEFANIFASKKADILRKEFKIEVVDHVRCIPVLVRTGAACDHAQSKLGPGTFFLGFLIPHDVTIRMNGKEKMPMTTSSWLSPTVFVLDNIYWLGVNFRFMTTAVPTIYSNWKPIFRIREQLLMKLISEGASYNSRPGIIQSFPKK